MRGKGMPNAAALLLVFLYVTVPSSVSAATPAATKPASAVTPTEQVRASVNNIVAILKNPSLKADSRKKDRREQLRRAIFSRFDFPEMAMRSMGSYWRKLSPKEQDEFVQLFTDLLERAYIDQIESYSDQKVVYTKETVDQDYAEVQSKLLSSKGEEFSLNYRVHLAGKEWKVYDVVPYKWVCYAKKSNSSAKHGKRRMN